LPASGIIGTLVADPPTNRSTVDELLAGARSRLARKTPIEAQAAVRGGAVLIDIRPVDQRRRDGSIPGAHVVSRNVLEWRLDPSCRDRDPELARMGCQVVLICDEGYQSSLAAATLCDFGLDATDVIGGAQEWIRSGLPTEAYDV
jgi:rhodanese-related sulfurtransferase